MCARCEKRRLVTDPRRLGRNCRAPHSGGICTGSASTMQRTRSGDGLTECQHGRPYGLGEESIKLGSIRQVDEYSIDPNVLRSPGPPQSRRNCPVTWERNSQILWMGPRRGVLPEISCGCSPPSARLERSGADELLRGEQLDDRDRLVTARTDPTRANSPAPRVALGTTLLPEVSRVAARADVDDVGLRDKGRGERRGRGPAPRELSMCARAELLVGPPL